MTRILPIGSVVLLKDATKRVMICGRFVTKVDDGKEYDYCACLYPEGIIDPKDLLMFNNEDIARVYYVGMQDVEEFEFQRKVIELLGKDAPKGE